MHGTWWLASLLLVGLVTTNNPWLQNDLYGRVVGFLSKAFGGIVGDAAHRVTNSYHNGRILCIPGYSTQFPQDRAGDPLMSAGIDITFRDVTEMIRSSARLLVALKARDPRVWGVIRELNGTLDGRTTFNYDVTLGRQNYQPDATHLWHDHLGCWRVVITMNPTAAIGARGIASVINGESLSSWLGGTTENVTPPIDTEDRTMLYLIRGSAKSAHPGAVFKTDGQTLTWVPGSADDKTFRDTQAVIASLNRAATNGRVGCVDFTALAFDPPRIVGVNTIAQVPLVDNLDAFGVMLSRPPATV